jgi:hypothetical protein
MVISTQRRPSFVGKLTAITQRFKQCGYLHARRQAFLSPEVLLLQFTRHALTAGEAFGNFLMSFFTAAADGLQDLKQALR